MDDKKTLEDYKMKDESVVVMMNTKIKPKNEAKSDNIENENKYEILKLQPINPETKTNSFCKAFFIASFPKTSNQIVEDSEGAISDCGHEDCSSLPGFEPEIQGVYLQKEEGKIIIYGIVLKKEYES